MEKDTAQREACQAITLKIQPYETGIDAGLAKAYLDAYGVDICHARFRMGMLENGIMVQTASVQSTKATALLVHGYFDHAAAWRNLVPLLLDNGCNVILFDLPGHGLSTGKRADIGDFGAYRLALASVLDFARKQSGALPLHIIAHSTGAGIAADLLLNHQDDAREISKVALIAPLLRNAHWNASAVGAAIASPFMDNISRRHMANSADAGFLSFVRQDPLQHNKLPFTWVKALGRWNKAMEASPVSSRAIFIVQGEKDNVVDWKYNIQFYMRHFPSAKVLLLPQAQHQIMNETPELRQTYENALLEYIELKAE